jgi:hypothetical protein
VVGREVAGREVVGREVVGREVAGREVMGREVVGRAATNIKHARNSTWMVRNQRQHIVPTQHATYITHPSCYLHHPPIMLPISPTRHEDGCAKEETELETQPMQVPCAQRIPQFAEGTHVLIFVLHVIRTDDRHQLFRHH